MEAKIAIAGDLELFNEIDKAKSNCPNLEKNYCNQWLRRSEP